MSALALFQMTGNSGGSRISQAEGGIANPKGEPMYYLANFSLKMKELD